MFCSALRFVYNVSMRENCVPARIVSRELVNRKTEKEWKLST